jgi:hypothetical protein
MPPKVPPIVPPRTSSLPDLADAGSARPTSSSSSSSSSAPSAATIVPLDRRVSPATTTPARSPMTPQRLQAVLNSLRDAKSIEIGGDDGISIDEFVHLVANHGGDLSRINTVNLGHLDDIPPQVLNGLPNLKELILPKSLAQSKLDALAADLNAGNYPQSLTTIYLGPGTHNFRAPFPHLRKFKFAERHHYSSRSFTHSVPHSER